MNSKQLNLGMVTNSVSPHDLIYEITVNGEAILVRKHYSRFLFLSQCICVVMQLIGLGAYEPTPFKGRKKVLEDA